MSAGRAATASPAPDTPCHASWPNERSDSSALPPANRPTNATCCAAPSTSGLPVMAAPARPATREGSTHPASTPGSPSDSVSCRNVLSSARVPLAVAAVTASRWAWLSVTTAQPCSTRACAASVCAANVARALGSSVTWRTATGTASPPSGTAPTATRSPSQGSSLAPRRSGRRVLDQALVEEALGVLRRVALQLLGEGELREEPDGIDLLRAGRVEVGLDEGGGHARQVLLGLVAGVAVEGRHARPAPATSATATPAETRPRTPRRPCRAGGRGCRRRAPRRAPGPRVAPGRDVGAPRGVAARPARAGR